MTSFCFMLSNVAAVIRAATLLVHMPINNNSGLHSYISVLWVLGLKFKAKFERALQTYSRSYRSHVSYDKAVFFLSLTVSRISHHTVDKRDSRIAST